MQQVIDVHTQLGVDDWLSRNQPTQIEGSEGWAHSAGLDDLMRGREELAALGLELRATITFPFPSAPEHFYRQGNELVADAAERSSQGRLDVRPLYAVDPFDAEERAWLTELLDRRRPCAGIKLNPFLGRPGGYDLYSLADDADLVDLLTSHHLVVGMHVGTGREHVTRPAFPNTAAGPMAAIELAQRLPEVPMLMLHLLRLSPTALAAAAELPNVHIELSGLSSIGQIREGGHDLLFAEAPPEGVASPAEALRWILDEFGLHDQLLFGTGMPFCTWWGSSIVGDAEILLEAGLEPMVLDKILHGNARRLFRLGSGVGP